MTSAGRAKEEAKYYAVEDLRAECAKDKQVPGTIKYDDPVCTLIVEDKNESWSCEVDVWSYCFNPPDD